MAETHHYTLTLFLADNVVVVLVQEAAQHHRQTKVKITSKAITTNGENMTVAFKANINIQCFSFIAA